MSAPSGPRTNDLRRLHNYNYWAIGRVRDVVQTLTPEEFTRDVGGSYGSVRNTLVHMLSAEWGWLDRCGGYPRGARLEPDAYATPALLFDQWNVVEGHLRAFLDGLTDADLDKPIEFALGTGPARRVPLGHLMQHAALHGVHHRGQVALQLRLLGRTPGNFDLVIYDMKGD